jgi:hypothetical protein
VVDVLEPICDGDVPYLGYSASFPGATTATITFVNPDGDDVVYSDLPLSGRVLWPGAVVDAEGTPLDWPGWTEVSPDVWVEGDEFDWVRPSVSVIIAVNPEEIFEIEYPPATPQCATNPPLPPGVVTTTTSPGALPPTR